MAAHNEMEVTTLLKPSSPDDFESRLQQCARDYRTSIHELANARKSRDEASSAAEKRDNDRQFELLKLQQKLDQQMIEKSELKEENETLHRNPQPRMNERRELEQRLDEGHRAYKCLQQDLETCTKGKLESKVQVIRLEAEVRGFRNDKDAAQRRIHELESGLQKIMADYQESKVQIKRLETDVKGMKDIRNVAQERILELQRCLEEDEVEHQELKDQLRERDNAIEAGNVIIQDLRCSLLNYKEVLLEEKGKSTNLQARLNSFVDAESKLMVMFQQRAGLVVGSPSPDCVDKHREGSVVEKVESKLHDQELPEEGYKSGVYNETEMLGLATVPLESKRASVVSEMGTHGKWNPKCVQQDQTQPHYRGFVDLFIEGQDGICEERPEPSRQLVPPKVDRPNTPDDVSSRPFGIARPEQRSSLRLPVPPGVRLPSSINPTLDDHPSLADSLASTPPERPSWIKKPMKQAMKTKSHANHNQPDAALEYGKEDAGAKRKRCDKYPEERIRFQLPRVTNA